MSARSWQTLHQAFVDGDLEALRAASGNPPDFPNAFLPDEGTGLQDYCLDYALYWSPLHLVKALLELGADPNYQAVDGFPSLFAAMSSNHEDRHERLKLLLEYGADVNRRGVNDYTPLHFAACQDDPGSIEILLKYGADPEVRTRIDNYGTPLEEAKRFGHARGAEALRKLLNTPGRS
ncbi:ankyrin repeat domain-containing protein [Microvirga yunnanensis]|uniref:ankyrin repeat domain-containing protein n=1 Tax=Microvirga yunnanensis TaxID=2953740 RepID=UPI0021C9F04F|nr:ankyrin repeat domain-containing protein [Microvirga sp. HBU65207]